MVEARRGGFELIVVRAILLASLALALAACGRIDATREFNYGLRYFGEQNFEAAIASFGRAAKAHSDPAIRYNSALAHLSALRSASNDGGSRKSKLDPKRVAAALDAVATARETPNVRRKMLARLGYIEGSIHVLSGNEPLARRAFQMSLEADPRVSNRWGRCLHGGATASRPDRPRVRAAA
jgi:hypothetical protein